MDLRHFVNIQNNTRQFGSQWEGTGGVATRRARYGIDEPCRVERRRAKVASASITGAEGVLAQYLSLLLSSVLY